MIKRPPQRIGQRAGKKGYTITEVLIVVVILSILATIAIPSYNGIIDRIEYKEVAIMYNLIRSAAKYYDLKSGLAGLATDDPAVYWAALKVDIADDAVCTYTLTGGAGNPKTMVVTDEDGVLLYSYVLPNGPGAINADSAYSKYIEGDVP